VHEGGGSHSVNKRLWVSADARERFQSALQGTPSIATVGLAAVCLKQHCRAFGVLIEPKGSTKLTREDIDLQLHSWCHATAFGVVLKKTGLGKRKLKLKKKPATKGKR